MVPPSRNSVFRPTNRRGTFVGILLLALSVGIFLPGLDPSASGTVSRPRSCDSRDGRHAGAPSLTSLGSADLRRIAREAYVWGWPLVYLHNCRVALERVPAPGRSGGMPVAPLNRLSMLDDRMPARATGVPCPNQDVIYGFGMFDLEDDAVVLQVPDFGGRFWLYQLGDQRTDSFAEVGSMHRTRPGHYLVVGPGWKGAIPHGIVAVLRCPTRYGFCLPRIFFVDSPADRADALAAVNRIAAYPLAEFTGEFRVCDWSRPRWFPSLATRGRARGVAPETFFPILSEVLAEVAPLPGEEALYDRFRQLLRAAAADPGIDALLRQMAADADRDLIAPLADFGNVGRPLPGRWRTIDNGAAFGTDYLTRAAVARSSVFVNRHHETKYYFLVHDGEGRRLDGSRGYRITFPPGSLPPARGFWSLTVYDPRHQLPAGSGRHAVGSRDGGLRLEADGSLTIEVARSPEADDEAGEGVHGNVLTPPEGEFSLALRLYWPAETALQGVWTPPPLEPFSAAPGPALVRRAEGRPAAPPEVSPRS